MKISELLKSKRYSLSFEVFPPKTYSNFESVKSSTEEIAKLSPSFMSVTYGAGGGTSEYTLAIAKKYKGTVRCALYRSPDLHFLHQTDGGKHDTFF